MLKTRIAIFFTVLFMATIVAPSVLILVDDTADISVFFNMTEEEEEKSKEKDKVETFLTETFSSYSTFFNEESRPSYGYYFKKYSKPHLNLISPPPQFI